MDSRAWQATVHAVAESDMTEATAQYMLGCIQTRDRLNRRTHCWIHLSLKKSDPVRFVQSISKYIYLQNISGIPIEYIYL